MSNGMKQPLQKDDVVKGYDTEGDIKEVIEEALMRFSKV